MEMRTGLLVALLAAGCGGGGDAGLDATIIDASNDAATDGATDAAIDAATDAAVDAGPPGFFVRGEVRCRIGAGLVLTNAGAPVTVDGDGHFAIPVADGATYDVTVATDPQGPAQHCVVAHGSGAIAGASVDDVVVSCSGAPRRWVAYSGHAPGIAGSQVRLATLDADGCPAPPRDVTPPGMSSRTWTFQPTPDRRFLAFDVWRTSMAPFYYQLAQVDLTATPPQPATIVGSRGKSGAWRMGPTGARVAWDSLDVGGTELVPLGGQPSPSTTLALDVVAPVTWSADGSRIAFTDLTIVGGQSARNGYVADVSTVPPHPLRRLNAMWPQGSCAAVRISPNGRFAFCQPTPNPPGNLLLVDLDSPTSTPIDLGIAAFIAPDTNLAISPDSRVAVIATPGRAYHVNLLAASPAAVPMHAPMAGGVAYVLMNPDGTRALIAGAGGQGLRPDLLLVDTSAAAPGAPVRLNPVDPGDGSFPAGVTSGQFAFNGARIIFTYRADSTHATTYWTTTSPVAVEPLPAITPGWGMTGTTLAVPGHAAIVVDRYQPGDPTFTMSDLGHAELGPTGWAVRQLNPTGSFLDDNSRVVTDDRGPPTLLFTARVDGGAQLLFAFDPRSTRPPQQVDDLGVDTVATFPVAGL